MPDEQSADDHRAASEARKFIETCFFAHDGQPEERFGPLTIAAPFLDFFVAPQERLAPWGDILADGSRVAVSAEILRSLRAPQAFLVGVAGCCALILGADQADPWALASLAGGSGGGRCHLASQGAMDKALEGLGAASLGRHHAMAFDERSERFSQALIDAVNEAYDASHVAYRRSREPRESDRCSLRLIEESKACGAMVEAHYGWDVFMGSGADLLRARQPALIAREESVLLASASLDARPQSIRKGL